MQITCRVHSYFLLKANLLICSEYSLEEVLLAEDLAISSETLVAQLSTALTALEALGVPRAVQHLQDEAVQNQLLTSTTFGDAGCKEESTRYKMLHFSVRSQYRKPPRTTLATPAIWNLFLTRRFMAGVYKSRAPVARATKVCTVAPNICEPSGGNFLYVIIPVPRILRLLPIF